MLMDQQRATSRRHACMCQDASEDVPIGRADSEIWVYMLDEQGEPVPVGVTGESVHRRVRVWRGDI